MSSHLLHCGQGRCSYPEFWQLSGESSSWHRGPGALVGQALAGEALGRSRLELPGLCQLNTLQNLPKNFPSLGRVLGRGWTSSGHLRVEGP